MSFNPFRRPSPDREREARGVSQAITDAIATLKRAAARHAPIVSEQSSEPDDPQGEPARAVWPPRRRLAGQ